MTILWGSAIITSILQMQKLRFRAEEKNTSWNNTAGLNSNLGLLDSKTLHNYTRPSREESKANTPPVLSLAGDRFPGPRVCGLQSLVFWLLAASIAKEKSDTNYIFSTGAIFFLPRNMSDFLLTLEVCEFCQDIPWCMLFFLIHPAWRSLGVLSIGRFHSPLGWRQFSCVCSITSDSLQPHGL